MARLCRKFAATDAGFTIPSERQGKMNTQRLTKVGTVLLLLVVGLAGATPALATPPEMVTIPVEASFTLATCDGFDVIDEYSGWLKATYFYDNDGDLERITIHESYKDRIYNSVTGFEESNNYAVNRTFDPVIGELFIRGLAYNITVPGYGIVFFDSGLGVFLNVDGQFAEIKFSGNYQADPAELCEAMDQ